MPTHWEKRASQPGQSGLVSHRPDPSGAMGRTSDTISAGAPSDRRVGSTELLGAAVIGVSGLSWRIGGR